MRGPDTLAGSEANLPISALLNRLGDTLDGLAGRTAQMQDELSRFMTEAGRPSRAQLRELQGLDLIHQTLDDLRAAAHLAAEAADTCSRIDIGALADLLRLESCRIALLTGGAPALMQERSTGEVDLF